MNIWSLFTRSIVFMLVSSLLVLTDTVQAQQIDILLKGGHVIDPKNGINSPMDVAVADGKIYRVAENYT